MPSQKVLLHDGSLLPRRPLPAALGRAGEEGLAPLLQPSAASAVAQALSLLPLCPAQGGRRRWIGHLGMDSSPQYLLPPSLGPGWKLWQRSGLLDVISCLQFRAWPGGSGGEEGPPQLTRLFHSPYPYPIPLTGNSLASCFPQPPFARPSYARSWSSIYHLRL